MSFDGQCLKPLKISDSECNTVNNGLCSGCNNDYYLYEDLFCYKNFIHI